MSVSETERESLAKLEALLDAYGAEPRRWPADRRAWAEALLARSAEAQALSHEAARLDTLIDAAGIDPVPAYLAGRVLAAAPPVRVRAGGWFAGLWKPAIGLACAAVLGVALGGVVSPFDSNVADAAEADTISLEIGSVPEVEL